MKTLLFDIDNTLIDTGMLRELHFNEIGEILNISQYQLSLIEKQYLDSINIIYDFVPGDFINQLLFNSIETDQNKILLRRVFFSNKESYIQCKYPNVEEALSKLKTKYYLGIFSAGDNDFQRAKLELTGYAKYFNNNLIFINRRKTAQLLISSLPQETIIIDDNISVIHELISYAHVRPIWFNNMYKTSGKIHVNEQVHSYDDLLNLLI